MHEIKWKTRFSWFMDLTSGSRMNFDLRRRLNVSINFFFTTVTAYLCIITVANTCRSRKPTRYKCHTCSWYLHANRSAFKHYLLPPRPKTFERHGCKYVVSYCTWSCFLNNNCKTGLKPRYFSTPLGWNTKVPKAVFRGHCHPTINSSHDKPNNRIFMRSMLCNM